MVIAFVTERGGATSRITSGAPSEKDGLDGREDDEQVEGDRQVLDVEQVVLQLLHRVFDAGPVGVPDLRPAGQPRTENVTLPVERNLFGQLPDKLGAFGPRAHQAHVPLEHVQELWELI